jgi:hypothetical protein
VKSENSINCYQYTITVPAGKNAQTSFPLSRGIYFLSIRDTGNIATSIKSTWSGDGNLTSQFMTCYEGLSVFNPDTNFDMVRFVNTSASDITVTIEVSRGQILHDFNCDSATVVTKPVVYLPIYYINQNQLPLLTANKIYSNAFTYSTDRSWSLQAWFLNPADTILIKRLWWTGVAKYGYQTIFFDTNNSPIGITSGYWEMPLSGTPDSTISRSFCELKNTKQAAVNPTSYIEISPRFYTDWNHQGDITITIET